MENEKFIALDLQIKLQKSLNIICKYDWLINSYVLVSSLNFN